MNQPRLIVYQPQYKEDFRRLNLEWIKKYFQVEKKDLEQLENPEIFLNSGGQIFFALFGELAVGTCALYQVEPGQYELAKMAVQPSHQGLGIGHLLMKGAEAWVIEQGGTEIMMLSNTVLAPAISLYLKHGYQITHLGPHPDYERCNIELKKRISSQPLISLSQHVS